MDTSDLIGRVSAAYLEQQLDQSDPASTARYLLDSLSADQTAAIATSILGSPTLASRVELKLPRRWLLGHGLPDDCLTDERATYFRNAPCAKPALLIATPGDDERQSLADLTVLDTTVLRAAVDLWVNVASIGLAITDQQRRVWIAALNGLNDVAQVTLDNFARYVMRVRHEVEEGHVFPDVMGIALPVLQWPRNAGLFRSLNEKTSGYASKWKQLFTTVQRKQACYLKKFTPTNQVLSADDLTTSFDKVKAAVPEMHHPAIVAFIAAPSRWNSAAESLANIDWEEIKPVFDGLRPDAFNLGEATLEFFGEQEEGSLSREELAYLQGLAKRKTSSDPAPEDQEFYRAHRLDLKDAPKLKPKWDRFIFGSPVETTDFLEGLAACLQALFDQNLPEGASRVLHITCDKRSKSDLRKLNIEAGQHFAFRYRGLRDLLGRSIFDVGDLFNFDQIHAGWLRESNEGKRKYKPNDSTARAALEIRFYVKLSVNEGEIESQRQLIWRYAPNAIGSELVSDWKRLVEHPFSRCEVNREVIGAKGQSQTLDLRDVRSLSAAFGQDRGSLVCAYRKDRDVDHIWRSNLAEQLKQGNLREDLASEVLDLYNDFVSRYRAAIKTFDKVSVSALEINEQYVAYGRLLEAVNLRARSDKLRENLLRPLLAIGVVAVQGAAPAAIVAPWNPLRMRAMSAKVERLVSLLQTLLHAPVVSFGDPALYFKEMRDELKHPYYPEIVLGWFAERKPELLSLSDGFLDYTLHEMPLRSLSGESETNDSPVAAATQIVDMVQRYLALYPHERSNLSAVLYNCDSAGLPQTVVDRVNELHEDDDEMRCEVVLRHRDREKLQHLYEQILESADTDNDGFIASEASRDFMARLRIGIMADEAPVPDAQDGPSKDIVFLHDVISRHAALAWYREDATPVAVKDLIPARWSRRRPSPRDEEKSIVYLCCPAQTKEGWEYITGITSFFQPDWHENPDRRYLPARQLNFHDPVTSTIFAETHNLGNWVVNYDELLDRRQLVNQGVRVIRYKQSATQGRNLLISSNASLGLLQSMLMSRIRDLAVELSAERVRLLSLKLIDKANQLSGDLVLRAAKRGRSASELIGVVLSHFLIECELGKDKRLGCYFIDDYAEWLGQEGEQIADLLLISPETLSDGTQQIAVVVTEAKYIVESSLAEKRKESQKQLRDSVRRIEEALFSDPPRLDGDLWLSRFSDLLLAGIPYSADDPIDLTGLRRKIREGTCRIFLRGYSHIFVTGPTDSSDCSDFTEVSQSQIGYQETYSRDKTRQLLLAFELDASPVEIRASVADARVLIHRDYRFPSTILSTVAQVNEDRRVGSFTSFTSKSADKAGADGSVRKADEEQAVVSVPALVEASSAPTKTIGVGSRKELGRSSGGTSHWAYRGIGDIIGRRSTTDDVTAEDAEWLRATVTKIRTALQQFQLNSKVVGESNLTPNAAIVRFQGAANMTVELVLRRRSELLTTYGLNVISVRGEPGVVSISIERQHRQTLHTLDVWKQWTPVSGTGNQRLLVAIKEDDSSLLFVSPTDNAPHTLIAGATGSGKSVLMQNLLVSIACTNRPEQAEIILIDPKMGVDYFAFEGLPHLGAGIIVEQEAAMDRLNGLLIEMDRRYAVLRANRCANIFELNSKPAASERLPCLWVVHDEFAEWMMTETYAETVSNVVSRLGVKARAAGIFLIFAAQRPDNQVMPMQLRANLGNRLILRVDSEGTSEIALGGEKGAERLLGRGHMAAKLEGNVGLIFCQVPFLSSAEIAGLVSAIVQAD